MLGHGYTDKPDYNYEIPRYVEHLVAYLDAQGIAGGGTKANPEVMERIKNSTTKAVTEDDMDLTRQRLHLLMFDGEKDVSQELVEIRHAIYHTPEFVANLHNLLCLQNMEIRQRNLMTTERLNSIAAPTLVVWGNENPFGEVPEATAMNEAIPNSRLELMGTCGHWPQHERHERYNPISIEFLRQHS